MLGISAIIAKSFARIFYRNAINVGLIPIIVNTDKIGTGDLLEIDLNKGTVTIKNKNIVFLLSGKPSESLQYEVSL